MLCITSNAEVIDLGMRKLLIADANEEFRLALIEQLREAYVIKACWDGQQALQLLHSMKPDVLVIDLMLPELDGISLLQRAAEAGLEPMVLATTRMVSDYVIEAVMRLGVGYLMVKPCDIKATIARIEDLSHKLKPQAVTRPDPEIAVTNMLLALGIPTKLRGFACLREAILEAVRQPGQLVTKELYPKVGKRCEGSSQQVERSIRSAIATAWETRDEQIWATYFPPGPSGNLERPTNAAMISRLASLLTVNWEQWL